MAENGTTQGNREPERQVPASLVGEGGQETSRKIRDLSLGSITLEEAGPAFSRTPDGRISLVADRTTWEAFGQTVEKPDTRPQRLGRLIMGSLLYTSKFLGFRRPPRKK